MKTPRPLFLARIVAALALLSAAPALRAGGACCAAPLPAEAPLPAASLYQAEAGFVTDSGKPFQLVELRGRPVAITMFFATCTYACPATTVDLARIREKLPEELRDDTLIVMVSFDTERDTPEVLHRFRESRGLSDDWLLLTGSDDSVRELAALLGVKFKRESNGQFAHSNLITILSREGEILHQRAGLSGGLDEAGTALAAAAAKPAAP